MQGGASALQRSKSVRTDVPLRQRPRRVSIYTSAPRKSSLADSTSQGVKSCIRKLSGQLNRANVVREVRGLFEDSGNSRAPHRRPDLE